MGCQDLWTGALGGLKSGSKSKLKDLKGKIVGVDVSISLYKACSKDGVAAAVTCQPRYPASDLLRELDRIHDQLTVEGGATLVYVFEGKDNDMKTLKKKDRLAQYVASRKAFENLLSKALRGETLTDEHLKEAGKLRKKMTAPDETIYGEVINHMKAKGRIMFGAPYEAEWQLVEMQLAGFLDYIISEDSDLIILKGSKIIVDLKFDQDPSTLHFQYMTERRCLVR
jgi:5'-3' exonuclease